MNINIIINSNPLTWEWVKNSSLEEIREKLNALAAFQFNHPSLSQLHSRSLHEYMKGQRSPFSVVELVHKLGASSPENQIGLIYQRLLGNMADPFLERSLSLFIENEQEKSAIETFKALKKSTWDQFLDALDNNMLGLCREMLIVHPEFLGPIDNEYGNTLLHDVCVDWVNFMPNDMEAKIQNLIILGADINCQNSIGYTPLHMACEDEDQLGLLKILIKYGACINITDHQGKTPLHIAILHRNKDAVEHLVGFLRSFAANRFNSPEQNGFIPPTA